MHQLGRIFLLLTIACAACGGDSNDGNGGNPASPTPPQGPATLQIVDLQLGTGDEANGTKTVQVHYTLWLYDPAGTDSKGARIESSRDRNQPLNPFRLGSNAVIPGFEQGIVGMKVGGIRRVTIPPNLAYGAAGQGPVPGNSWIVFEIELLATAP